MARQTQNGTTQDQNSAPLRDVQQGFNSGYDAAADKERGDESADESEELTNALNPIKSRPTAAEGGASVQPKGTQRG